MSDDWFREACARSSRYHDDRRRQEEFRQSRRRMYEGWEASARRRGDGSSGDLVTFAAIVIVGLFVAAYFGHSPADIWDWVHTRVTEWLNG